MRKRFNEQEAKKIADMYMSGMTMADIQRLYGLPNYGSIVTALESQGVKRRDKSSVLRRFTDEEEAEIAKIYNDGSSARSIAISMFGKASATQTILNVLNRQGVELRGRAAMCAVCGMDDRNDHGRCKECVRRRSKKWYHNNRERMAELSSRWYHGNKERVYAAKHKRRAMLEGNGGSYTDEEWQELLEKYNSTCLRCGRDDVPMTRDHVIPVIKGGTGYIENIQPLCGSCNRSKGIKKTDYRKGPHAKENMRPNGGESG